VAVRNTQQKKKNRDSNLGCLLMLAFLLLLIGLLLFNRESIANTLRNTRFVERVMKKEPQKPGKSPVEAPAKGTEPARPAAEPGSGTQAPQPTKPTQQPAPQSPAPQQPAPSQPSAQQQPAPQQTAPLPSKPEAVKTTAVKPPAKQPDPAAAESRERTLWFVRVENDGLIARVAVKRKLPASDTPLVDALNALAAGPSPEERKKGYSSLIPAGTKLLSATVRGTTAYLSFNDQFQFNSFGIEGYAAQLRQIVWTATEFDSVKDVQFLIEGRRVDYLGAEGIFIGSPVGRDSF
jgi:germination protein M